MNDSNDSDNFVLYFNTSNGLIGMDALILISCLLGLLVLVNPKKGSKTFFAILAGLLLVIRLFNLNLDL